MKIQCSEEDCVSRTSDETPFFSVSVTVDGDKDVAENISAIPASQFTCNYCHSPAKGVEDE